MDDPSSDAESIGPGDHRGVEFTGERYVPELTDALISYEHWHRYMYAAELVGDRSVLDVACGEGYGTYLLARRARSVVGVDISEETIRFASSRYLRRNLSFTTAAASELPADWTGAFEVVVSFETIEHLDEAEQRAFLDEVRRVLAPGGLFIVSTPNKLTYSDLPDYSNQFHRKELYVQEFRDVLEERFGHVMILGQKVQPVSYLWDVAEGNSGFGEFEIALSQNGFRPAEEPKPFIYAVAVCSDAELQAPSNSVLVDLSEQYNREREETALEHIRARDRTIDELGSRIAEIEELRQRAEQALQEQEAAAREQIQLRERTIEDLGAHIAEIEERRQALEGELTALREEHGGGAPDLRGRLVDLQGQRDSLSQILEAERAEFSRTEQAFQAREAAALEEVRAHERSIEALREQLATAERERAELAQSLEAQQRARAAAERASQDLAARLEEHKSAYDQVYGRLEGRDRVIQANDALIRQQEQRIRDLTAHAEELERATQELRSAVNRWEAHWIEVQNTRAWRLANRVRRIRGGIASFLRALNPFRRARGGGNAAKGGRPPLLQLDEPEADSTHAERVKVRGWAVATDDPISRVEARIGDAPTVTIALGQYRPDVARALGEPDAEWCGYEATLPLDGLQPGTYQLTVSAVDAEGREQRVTRSIEVTVRFGPSAPFPSAESAVGAAAAPVAQSPLAPAIVPAAPPRQAEEQPAIAPHDRPERDLDAGLRQEIAAIVEDFESRQDAAPAILDWNSGIQLARLLPEQTVFSPPAASRTDSLPYLDSTVDIVVISHPDAARLAEARRIASGAVIAVDGDGAAPPPGDGTGATGQSRLAVEWLGQLAAGEQDESHSEPTASIIVPVYNQSTYTDSCLRRVLDTLPRGFRGEIIVVDDASTDNTPEVLDRWRRTDDRVRAVRNDINLGFVGSCNRGAEAATSDVLVFLNNDTLPEPRWLAALLKTLRDHPDAGAVGGKLVYPNGTLQEAGGVIFSDGSGWNFGRNDPRPNKPLYSYVREVDYCSGALLATPRALFREIGGFDPQYAPAYYEDTDYCFNVREKGYRVYYQPASVVVHCEGITAGTDLAAGVKRYQAVNHDKFVEKWAQALQRQPDPPAEVNEDTLFLVASRPVALK